MILFLILVSKGDFLYGLSALFVLIAPLRGNKNKQYWDSKGDLPPFGRVWGQRPHVSCHYWSP